MSGSGERTTSTTASTVRILQKLLRNKDLGRYVVPIVPDEARTFGLESLFRAAGIYAPDGQRYTPVDDGSLLPYREETDGQVLQEGICETGAMASFLAAGTAYAMHGVPTIPFYMFYSIFGFQRVGDMIWSCADMMCRGFLLGGTAGRTTLNGEGLQHQDGHSQLVASTIPNLKSYDPAFAFELALIIRDGIYRMYTLQEQIFYYLTVYNEVYPMPAAPAEIENVEAGVLAGIYCFKRSEAARGGQSDTGHAVPDAETETAGNNMVQLLGSGSIMLQVLEAATMLEDMGIAANVWSVTSYNELQRDALSAERWNRLHPQAVPRKSYLSRVLDGETGVFVAASDYMKAVPNGIAPWIPGRYAVLGTDGFGLSESRDVLRDHFEISPAHIVVAALHALSEEGIYSPEKVAETISSLGIDAGKIDPVTM